MPNFFMSLLKSSGYTLHALVKGPSKTLQEMHTAQANRVQAFTGLMTSLTYKPHQILARRQYWCSQTFFLAQLIKENHEEIAEIIKAPVSVDNEAVLLDTINQLLIALDDKGCLQKFLTLLQEDSKKIEMTQGQQNTAPSLSPNSGIQFRCVDVIQLISELSAEGKRVVVDNAPNSHRDGAAKYSAGSVEELFSRYTDEALKMVLHFDDVHQRNYKTGHYAFAEKPEPIDVEDYQKRYLMMVLTICAKLIKQKEAYLESETFFNELFASFPNINSALLPNKLPIYFGVQNNVYEVPVDGGFTSSHWFADTKNLNTVAGIFQLLQTQNALTPMTVVSYAAPDLRQVETSPLDARSTSNRTLQHPEVEGTLGSMLTAGISLQCKQAIKLAQQYKETGINQPVAAVFIMPGCGAFNNPEKVTAAYFISSIKSYYPELAKHNITCYVAEYNPKLFNILLDADKLHGPELDQLHVAINIIADPVIRKKAIAVREKIIALYEGGPDILTQHVRLTTQLLMSQPGEERKKIAAEYRKNALEISKNSNELWKTLGIAMMVLVGVVVVALNVNLLSGGAALLVGIGLFSKSRGKGLTEITGDLIDELSTKASFIK